MIKRLPPSNQGLLVFSLICFVAGIILTIFVDGQYWLVILISVISIIAAIWPEIRKAADDFFRGFTSHWGE